MGYHSQSGSPKVITINKSLHKEPELNKAENAWKPSKFEPKAATGVLTDEEQTEVLLRSYLFSVLSPYHSLQSTESTLFYQPVVLLLQKNRNFELCLFCMRVLFVQLINFLSLNLIRNVAIKFFISSIQQHYLN